MAKGSPIGHGHPLRPVSSGRLKMKFGVLIFPGSNCEHDAYHAVRKVLQQPAEFIWHQSTDLKDCQAIIVPGGFSYGDYLRTGAIARFSPVMGAVRRFADGGGLVLGICNGFQILLESGLLPGAMLRNRGLKYVCQQVSIRVENARTPFTGLAREGDVWTIPIGHMEGNYTLDSEALQSLEKNRQVVFRYCSPDGEIAPWLQSQRLGGQCGRDLQSPWQRAGNDASPGKSQRTAAGKRGRGAAFSVDDPCEPIRR